MKVNADEIRTYEHARFYYQLGGPGPQNRIFFSGVDGIHILIDSVSIPIRGSITPINARNPTGPGYKRVGISRAPADFATATVQALEPHGVIPWVHGPLDCPLNLYEALGNCSDLSDFITGWDTLRIYSLAEAMTRNDGTRSAWDSDAAQQTSLDLVLPNGVYTIGGYALGETAATAVTRPIVSITYGDTVRCGHCGTPRDGTQVLYALQQTDLHAVAANVLYSTNKGGSWTAKAINGIGATETVVQIGVVGQYLVVLAQNAMYYASINTYTGVPGNFTKVTTGLDPDIDLNAMYVANKREVWFAGIEGYIYKSTNIPMGFIEVNAGGATSNNLYGIHGHESTLVAVGSSETVIQSINGGETWTQTPADPAFGVGVPYTDVAVIDRDTYWIVGPTISYTNTAGNIWTEVELSDDITQIRQVLFVTEDVGYILGLEGAGGGLWATFDGGHNWVKSDVQGGGRWISAPSFLPSLALAAPLNADVNYAVNNLAVAGEGASTDGLILLGAAAFK